MWEWLNSNDDEAAAKLEERLDALGDEAFAVVDALDLPHNTSNPCWKTWCVRACVVCALRLAAVDLCAIQGSGRRVGMAGGRHRQGRGRAQETFGCTGR